MGRGGSRCNGCTEGGYFQTPLENDQEMQGSHETDHMLLRGRQFGGFVGCLGEDNEAQEDGLARGSEGAEDVESPTLSRGNFCLLSLQPFSCCKLFNLIY